MTTTNSRATRVGLLPRALLLLWSAAILGAALTAPWAASAGRAEGWFLYEAFEPFCHQQPERSWTLHGYPLAVCVRCIGFYAGLLLAALAGLRLPVKAVLVTVTLMGASWAAELSGLVATPEEIRFVTGFALGFSMGAAVMACAAPPAPNSQRQHGTRSIA